MTDEKKLSPLTGREVNTDYQPAFYLSKQQREQAVEWMKAHDAEKHVPPGAKHRYNGAIGGAYTWSFTPTTIGTVVSVECSCGDKIDVSDF